MEVSPGRADYGDFMLVGQVEHFFTVEHQGFSGGYRKASRPGVDHGPDGGNADDRHVETHILSGLSDLYDCKLSFCQFTRAPNRSVGSLHSLDSYTCTGANYYGLSK